MARPVISVQQLERAVASIANEVVTTAVERVTVREAARLLGAERVTLAFFDAAGQPENVTRYRVGGTSEESPILFPEEEFIRQAYLQDQRVTRTVSETLGLPAVAVPCRLGGRTIGALAVVFGVPDRAATPEELEALSLIGSVAAAMIENARLTSSVQQGLGAPRELSERWLGYVEAAPSDMILVCDMKGRVVDANQAMCRALGYTWHELVHRDIAALVPSPSGQEDQALLRSLLDGIAAGHVTNFESAFITKSGRVMPIEVRARPVDDDGRTVLIGVIRDLTERKRAEAQLVQVDRLRSLGEMAAGVAHDVNNMLTAALGPIELILATTIDPITRRELPVVQQALLDCALTVRRIQAFARQSGAAQLVPVELTALARDVIELARPRWQTRARERDVSFQVDVVGAESPPVMANPAELREVLVNMINNAVDAMPKGGRITISVESAGPSVVLRVADTGVGMAPEVAQRVFDPFFSTKGVRGSGLGLSVVYGIVARHRGDIMVESTPGKGTTFMITLPVARPEEIASAAEKVDEKVPTAAAGVSPERALSVLVLDDQPAVARVLQLMLEHQKHRVRAFTKGPEALAALREETYDLVCTDLNMPGMSGWEIASAVKGEFPDLPVALLTGWDEGFTQQDLQSRGVDFVLKKPYQIGDVLALIDQIRHRATSATGA